MKEETRVSSSLSSKEYNDVYATYANRPTWVKIQDMSDGNTTLRVEMEHYAYNPTATYSPENLTPQSIAFDKRYVNQYLPLIDKFLQWEAKAQTRGDAFTKEIGSALTWSQIGSLKLKFTFHSGNRSSHLLAIGLDAGLAQTNVLYFDRANAIELRKLISGLQSGQTKQTPIDEIYN